MAFVLPLLSSGVSSLSALIGAYPLATAGAAAGAIGTYGASKLLGNGRRLIDDAKAAPALLGNAIREQIIKSPKHIALSWAVSTIESWAPRIPEEILEDEANGVETLIELKDEIKDFLKRPDYTKPELDALYTRFVDTLQNTELHVHGFSLRAHKQEAGPSLDELQNLVTPEAPRVEQTIEQIGLELNQKITVMNTCIRRKAEIFSVFGSDAATDLLSKINSSEAEYRLEFEKQVNDKLANDGITPILQPVYKFIYNFTRLFAGFAANLVLIKVNKVLNQGIQSLLSEERTRIMDFIAKIVYEGLHLYTSEMINISDEILHTHNGLEGTVDQMITERMEKKKSLHAGFSNQKELYSKLLDRFLANSSLFSIEKLFWKYLVNKSGILENPFQSASQSIRDANGFHYTLDKNIVEVVEPILKDLREANSSEEAEQGPVRAYSQINKDTLSKAIKSLFVAVDLNSCANIAELSQVLTRAQKEPSLTSFDGIITTTAEAGALSILESLNRIITPKFLLERSVRALDAINSSFASEESIEEVQLKIMEKRRRHALSDLTSVIIHSAVESAPDLNRGKIHDKMNEKIKAIKDFTAEKAGELRAYTENAKPQELFTKLIDDLRTFKDSLRDFAELEGFSDSQTNCLENPLRVFQKALEPIITSFEKPEAERQTSYQRAIQDLVELLETPAFALKAYGDIMELDLVKKAGKLGLEILLKNKFDKAYLFACDPKTIKYLGIHQTIGAILKH